MHVMRVLTVMEDDTVIRIVDILILILILIIVSL